MANTSFFLKGNIINGNYTALIIAYAGVQKQFHSQAIASTTGYNEQLRYS